MRVFDCRNGEEEGSVAARRNSHRGTSVGHYSDILIGTAEELFGDGSRGTWHPKLPPAIDTQTLRLIAVEEAEAAANWSRLIEPNYRKLQQERGSLRVPYLFLTETAVEWTADVLLAAANARCTLGFGDGVTNRGNVISEGSTWKKHQEGLPIDDDGGDDGFPMFGNRFTSRMPLTR